MTSAIVQRFRDVTAPRLLERFGNGGVKSVLRVITPNIDPLLKPTTVETKVEFNASVRGVSSAFVGSDPNLVSTDLQAICAAIDFTPVTGGQVEVNGDVRLIVRVDAIPAAGLPAAYRFFLR